MAERVAHRGLEQMPTELSKNVGDDCFDVDASSSSRPSTRAEVDVARELLLQHGADPKKVGATVQIGKFRDRKTGELSPAGPMTTEDGERIWVKFPTPDGKNKHGMSDEEKLEYINAMTPPKPRISPVRTTARTRGKTDKVAAVWSDIQHGFRRLIIDGEEVIVSTHDPRALNVARQVIKYAQPDRLIDLGDALDFESFSRFSGDRRAHGLLGVGLSSFQHDVTGGFRADNPNAEYDWLGGNHEERLFKQIYDRFPELADVRQINPDGSMGRVALSLEAILHLDQLRVKYHGGYPANRLKINDRLYAMHGHASKGSKGSTTNHYLHNSDMPTISKLSGHTHRNESSSRRVRLGEDEWRVVSADSFGTLCKVDGTVQGHGTGHTLDGVNVASTPNWEHGFGFIEYRDGDAPFDVHHVRIHTEDGYMARWGGRTFYPTVDGYGNPL